MREAIKLLRTARTKLRETRQRLGGERDRSLESWLAGMCTIAVEDYLDEVIPRLAKDVRETRASQARRAAEMEADERRIERRRAKKLREAVATAHA